MTLVRDQRVSETQDRREFRILDFSGNYGLLLGFGFYTVHDLPLGP